MAHYNIVILNGQSNINGVRSKGFAPVGTFTSNVITGVKVWNGSAIVDFDVTNVGSTGNGHTWVGVGSSSSGNYCWGHLILRHLVTKGLNVLAVCVTEGGSSLRLKTILNGSHNVDTTTLAATYPTTPVLHTALVNRINSCTTYLTANGHTYQFDYYLFDQEEADTLDAVNDRATILTAKFSAIRTLTANSALKILYCTRPKGGTFNVRWMERADFEVAALDVNNYCFNLHNGSTLDGAHFDDATMLAIKNYFVLNVIDGNTAAPQTFAPPSRFFASGKAFDELEEFIKVTGISSSTEIDALDYFITQTKAAGLWDYFEAIYPMVGSTQARCQINLKNAYLYTTGFEGGNTYNADGWTANGTTGILRSGVRLSNPPDMSMANWGVDMFSNTNQLASVETLLSSSTTTQGAWCRLFLPSTTGAFFRLDVNDGAFNLSSEVLANSYGLYSAQVRSGFAEIFKDGVFQDSKAYAGASFSAPEFVFGQDIANDRFLSKKIGFIIIRRPLTPSQLETLAQIVYDVMDMLGRTTVPTYQDPDIADVTAYATSNSFTAPGAPFLTKLDTFITSQYDILKRCSGVWIAKNGGSATDFARINIVNPSRLLMTFPNGITYNANGWTGNGTTQYGQPGFNSASQSVEAPIVGDARYKKNSASRFMKVGAVGNAFLDGTLTTANRNCLSASISTTHRINSGSAALSSSYDMTGSNKFKAITRLNDTTVRLDNDGVRGDRTQSSSLGLTNENQILLGQGSNRGTSTIEAYGIGPGLNDTELDSLRTALATLLT